MRKVSLEIRVEDRDEVVGRLLVELSTADMSKPTLSRIDHLVIARVRQRNRGLPTDFYFFQGGSNCSIAESCH